MPSLGPWEIGLILVIVIIIFGVGKLPDLGGALGRSIREFRHGAETGEVEADKSARREEKS